MITYVNAKNAAKYQILFDKATKVLNDNPTSEGSITISSLARYFSVLKDLMELDPTFIRLPLDEEPFEIDLNTRKIAIPSDFTKNGVGVKGDQLAEIVYFKVNRFFDAQDLKNTDIYIEWSTGKQKGISKAFCVDTKSSVGNIIFGWAITSAMTQDGGATLTFAPRFVKETTVSEDSVTLTYSLSTTPHTVKILDTLDLKNTEDVTVDNTDADLIFSRIVNSNLDGEDVIVIDKDGNDFNWSNQPSGEVWFKGDVGRTVFAEAWAREGYLSYQWEEQNGENWSLIGDSSNQGDFAVAFDYTLFRNAETSSFLDNVVYYEQKEDGTYSGYLYNDPNTELHFSITADETPVSGKNYYIVYTGNDTNYGRILENVVYYVKTQDEMGYEILSAVENYKEGGTFLGKEVEPALIRYGKIYKRQSSYKITKPGTYRAKATVSTDGPNSTEVATIYSTSVTAPAPEEVKTSEIGSLSAFNKAISSEVQENVKYYYEETLEEVDHSKIAVSQTLTVDATSIQNLYPHSDIAYQWVKDGVNIENGTTSNYTATEPGVYTIKVTNSVNGASKEHFDTENFANITALPNQPVADWTEGTAAGNVTKGQPLKVVISQDLPSEGLYFAWKKMVIDPTQESSIDTNVSENDINVWGTALLPEKTQAGTFENTYTPDETGVYYCLVYNSLNGILSSPLKVGNFTIVEG